MVVPPPPIRGKLRENNSFDFWTLPQVIYVFAIYYPLVNLPILAITAISVISAIPATTALVIINVSQHIT